MKRPFSNSKIFRHKTSRFLTQSNPRVRQYASTLILRHSNAETARYAFNAVLSTVTDFSTFHLLADIAKTEIVTATLSGNVFGAVNSFLLLHFWVFKDISGSKLNKKISKFALGVVFCTLCNMLLVALFHYWLGWSAWFSRIFAAMIAGLLGYWYNKCIVFKG